MKQVNNDAFLWVEKYRPQTLDDMILPKEKKVLFEKMVNAGEIQNLFFSSPAGRGKTAIAKVLCNDLGITPLFINASEENGIDVLRTKIKEYASTVSLDDTTRHKIVIMDESDFLTASFQGAVRSLLESFSSNCRFIFTANFKNKIIDPILSRMVEIEFSDKDFKEPSVVKQMVNRICFILKNEGVSYDKEVVVQFIIKYAPDIRKIINRIQRYAQNEGEINTGLLGNASSSDDFNSLDFSELRDAIRNKSFKKMRQWVIDNQVATDSQRFMRELYDSMNEMLEPSSVPQMVLLLGEYQYKASLVVDQEINIVALLTEVMAKCHVK